MCFFSVNEVSDVVDVRGRDWFGASPQFDAIRTAEAIHKDRTLLPTIIACFDLIFDYSHVLRLSNQIISL